MGNVFQIYCTLFTIVIFGVIIFLIIKLCVINPIIIAAILITVGLILLCNYAVLWIIIGVEQISKWIDNWRD